MITLKGSATICYGHPARLDWSCWLCRGDRFGVGSPCTSVSEDPDWVVSSSMEGHSQLPFKERNEWSLPYANYTFEGETSIPRWVLDTTHSMFLSLCLSPEISPAWTVLLSTGASLISYTFPTVHMCMTGIGRGGLLKPKWGPEVRKGMGVQGGSWRREECIHWCMHAWNFQRINKAI